MKNFICFILFMISFEMFAAHKKLTFKDSSDNKRAYQVDEESLSSFVSFLLSEYSRLEWQSFSHFMGQKNKSNSNIKIPRKDIFPENVLRYVRDITFLRLIENESMNYNNDENLISLYEEKYAQKYRGVPFDEILEEFKWGFFRYCQYLYEYLQLKQKFSIAFIQDLEEGNSLWATVDEKKYYLKSEEDISHFSFLEPENTYRFIYQDKKNQHALKRYAETKYDMLRRLQKFIAENYHQNNFLPPWDHMVDEHKYDIIDTIFHGFLLDNFNKNSQKRYNKWYSPNYYILVFKILKREIKKKNCAIRTYLEENSHGNSNVHQFFPSLSEQKKKYSLFDTKNIHRITLKDAENNENTRFNWKKHFEIGLDMLEECTSENVNARVMVDIYPEAWEQVFFGNIEEAKKIIEDAHEKRIQEAQLLTKPLEFNEISEKDNNAPHDEEIIEENEHGTIVMIGNKCINSQGDICKIKADIKNVKGEKPKRNKKPQTSWNRFIHRKTKKYTSTYNSTQKREKKELNKSDYFPQAKTQGLFEKKDFKEYTQSVFSPEEKVNKEFTILQRKPKRLNKRQRKARREKKEELLKDIALHIEKLGDDLHILGLEMERIPYVSLKALPFYKYLRDFYNNMMNLNLEKQSIGSLLEKRELLFALRGLALIESVTNGLPITLNGCFYPPYNMTSKFINPFAYEENEYVEVFKEYKNITPELFNELIGLMENDVKEMERASIHHYSTQFNALKSLIEEAKEIDDPRFFKKYKIKLFAKMGALVAEAIQKGMPLIQAKHFYQRFVTYQVNLDTQDPTTQEYEQNENENENS